ncbi:MAG: metal ABC transporter solute-binding protein, Zn/Mn family, partial [Marinobacterium sp.]
MKLLVRSTLSTLSLSAALLTALPAAAADVVTSIKPLQLITSALTAGITEPELLLPPEGTPHHYALKPSDMRKLTEARVVIWVGPGLEQFLQKPLSRTDAEIVTLLPDSVAHEHGVE